MQHMILNAIFEQLVKLKRGLSLIHQYPGFNGYIVIIQKNVPVYKKSILKCLRVTVHHFDDLSNGSGAK